MTLLDLMFVDDGWLQVFVGANESQDEDGKCELIIGLKELFESLIFFKKRK